MYRNELKFKWDQLTDLRSYRIALIKDYTYTPQIWGMANKGEFKSETLQNDLAHLAHAAETGRCGADGAQRDL